jgi:tRNA pseudouridine55 synthase
MTSHDAVALARKRLRVRKAGHTGTLDPMAEGVLPVTLGAATKLSDLLTEKDKEYRARVQLGFATDTGDATGKITARFDKRVCLEEILLAARAFSGEIAQTPPMYSAVKVGGKKLYELARKGIEIERAPRAVTVYKLEISGFDEENQAFTMDVACSKGTYIRSLSADLGQALGCGATLSALTRTAAGPFRIETAVSPFAVTEADVLPVETVLGGFAAVYPDAAAVAKVKNGLRMRPEQLGIQRFSPDERFRIYENEKSLIALGRALEKNGETLVALEKTFWTE